MQSPVVIRRCGDYDEVDPVLEEILEASGIARDLQGARRVLLKPNQMLISRPEDCRTTDPRFLAALTRVLRHRGLEVLVGDSSGWIGFTRQVLSATGVEEAVRREGATVISLDAGPFRLLPPAGRPPVALVVPEVLFEVDGVLSVPKLLAHPFMGLSLSLKNLMGILPGALKPGLHVFRPGPDDLAGALLDLHRLTAEAGVRWAGAVVDGIWALGGRGGGVPPLPRYDFGLVAGGRDLAAVDLACAVAAGFSPEELPLCRVAASRGRGPAGLEGLSLDGPDPRAFGPPLARPGRDWAERTPWRTRAYYFVRSRLVRPGVDRARCRGHQRCVVICPASAVIRIGGRTIVGPECIRCLACVEQCPEGAIDLRSPWALGFLYRRRVREARKPSGRD